MQQLVTFQMSRIQEKKGHLTKLEWPVLNQKFSLRTITLCSHCIYFVNDWFCCSKLSKAASSSSLCTSVARAYILRLKNALTSVKIFYSSCFAVVEPVSVNQKILR